MRSFLFLAVFLACASFARGQETPRLYADHCASCHAPDRLGGIGPALLPENLGRMKVSEIDRIIATGRQGTQMPGFDKSLPPDAIAALAHWVLTPLPDLPVWGIEQIAASHRLVTSLEALPATPPFASDPLNLFTVVEGGDHHVTILDGDRMEPLYRFPSRFSLHGGAKYSPDGRFVFLMSRDGWVAKIDMWTGSLLAEIRAGINSRNIAVSDDGAFVAVGNALPHTLVILEAGTLKPRAVLPVTDQKDNSSRVSAVYTAPPRHSFIVALKDLPELWEIPYGQKTQEGFPIQRLALQDPLDDFFFDPSYDHVMGTSRDGQKGRVIGLTSKREVARLDLSGFPHLGSGIVFFQGERMLMATPHLKEAIVSIIDMRTWETVKRIPTLGPGFFIRSHEKTPYAWVDVSMGSEKDALHIIDTQTLEIVRTLHPAPGRLTRHVEFTRDGRFALVSLAEKDGALLILDSTTFAEVKRLPMCGPIGKYNVFNKINLSSGTSH